MFFNYYLIRYKYVNNYFFKYYIIEWIKVLKFVCNKSMGWVVFFGKGCVN